MSEQIDLTKSPGAAKFLCLFFGWMGLHRFYLKRPGGGLMMAWFVFGFVGSVALGLAAFLIWAASVLVWWFIEAVHVDKWTGELRAARAEAEERLEFEGMVEVLTLPLMRAAQKHGGKLTVAEGVLATGLTITETEAVLVEMSKTGYVQIENTERGDLLFDFGDLPEYDEEEAMREAELEARELAVEEAAAVMDAGIEQVARGQKSAAIKGGIAGGVAAFGARALMGALLGDDDDEWDDE